ncbi:hypothetical protein AAKU67_000958 [Oxalobacteraceae bacterium GrIS 2.11]
MKIIWVLLLAILRPIYFIYSFVCLSAFLLICYVLAYFFWPQLPAPELVTHVTAEFILAAFAILAVIIPVMVYRRKTDDDPNPFQSAFMSWFGTLRWYWNTTPGPMAKVGLPSGYLVENPMNYRINAKDMRAILAVLQPGDILLRAYDGYMDGDFIRHSSLCSTNGYRPGWFTHAALYAGQLNDEDKGHVPEKYRLNKRYFQEGPQMVLHSMAMGVHTEDILTWFRCDYLVVLRLKDQLKLQEKIDSSHPSKKKNSASDFFCQRVSADLRNGMTISSAEAIQNARQSALEKVGEPYDFECVQTDKYTRFSCAEYVYYCYRSIHDALGLSPQLHALYPLGMLSRHFSIMGRSTITPDDFYQLARDNHLDIVWIDEISKKKA